MLFVITHQTYEPNLDIQEILVEVHHQDPEASIVCERLVDVDEGLQERTIGHKSGTGGSSGVKYLNTTVSHPIFADL